MCLMPEVFRGSTLWEMGVPYPRRISHRVAYRGRLAVWYRELFSVACGGRLGSLYQKPCVHSRIYGRFCLPSEVSGILPIAEPKLDIGHTLIEDIPLVMHIACPSAGLIIVAVKVAWLMQTSCSQLILNTICCR